MPAGPVGSVWTSGSWSNTAWEENTWADAPISTGACPIGSVWASGSWSDTSWICDTWADVVTGGACEIGSVWASGSWSDTSWICETWADTGALSVINPGDEVMVIIEGGILCRVFKHDDGGGVPVRVVIESPKRITVLTEGGSAIKVII